MLHSDTTEHLHEARNYIRSIAAEGLDINALYIAQAYLTKLQASLRPVNVLDCLFKEQDLAMLVELSCGASAGAVQSSQYNQRIISEPLLKYFKAAPSQQSTHHFEHSSIQISQLINRILDSLEEWDIITRRADTLTSNFQSYRLHKKETFELRKMEISLEQFLDSILRAKQNTEFITAESENNTCSIAKSYGLDEASSQIDDSLTDLSKQKALQFVQYLSMWMSQTLQQICQLKGILEQAKSESSLDNEEHMLTHPTAHNRKVKVAKRSLLTSKIKEGHLDIPHIDGNFFDENQRPKTDKRNGAGSVIDFPRSEMSFLTHRKTDKQTKSHRVTLGALTMNKEIKARESSKNCSHCQVY